MFGGFNVIDFKVSKVNGVDKLTGIYKHNNSDIVLNNDYTIYERLHAGKNESSINIHGFNTVENGTTALVITMTRESAILEEAETVGFDAPPGCKVEYPGFEAYDTTRWQKRFAWSARGHVPLDDVYIRPSCYMNRWDYLCVLRLIDSCTKTDLLTAMSTRLISFQMAITSSPPDTRTLYIRYLAKTAQLFGGSVARGRTSHSMGASLANMMLVSTHKITHTP